jgi:hypothetical protein
MPQIDTKTIRERAAKACAGPWTAVDCNLGFGKAYVIAENESGAVVGVCHDADPGDAAFIASARTDVLALCDEVERVRAQSAHWKAKYEALDAELSEGVDECEAKALTENERLRAENLNLRKQIARMTLEGRIDERK